MEEWLDEYVQYSQNGSLDKFFNLLVDMAVPIVSKLSANPRNDYAPFFCTSTNDNFKSIIQYYTADSNVHKSCPILLSSGSSTVLGDIVSKACQIICNVLLYYWAVRNSGPMSPRTTVFLMMRQEVYLLNF